MSKNEKQRPLGIVLVALFYLLVSLFFIIKAVRQPETIAAVLTPPQVVIFALMVAMSPVITMGLLMLGNWARYLMVLHLFLNGVSFVLVGYSPFNISTLVNALLVAYVFFHPVCRSAFARGHGE